MKSLQKKSSPIKKKQAPIANKKPEVVAPSPIIKKQQPLVMKVMTSTLPPATMPKVEYSTIPPTTIVDTEQQYTIMPSPSPFIQEDRIWMTTSMTPSITQTLSRNNEEVMTTITPIQVITETLAPKTTIITPTTTMKLDNLNFVSPAVDTNNSVYVLSNTLYTPIPGWDIKIDYTLNKLSSLGPTTPTTQAGNVIIGNGTSGGFGFATLNTIPSTKTQYAIIQYNNSSFNGTYSTNMSYQVHFPSSGKFKLIYYIQARPRMLAPNKVTWKVKYNASQTIRASIQNASTADYSFGTGVMDWGIWKKQELPFTITEPGTYPLTFKSTLVNFTGATDSAIAFGAISFQSVS